MSSPPVIGIVGGIGAGKSIVAEILASLGCFVADADQYAREALEDRAVLEQLREHWGAEVIREDGSPDRAAIAAIVFIDDAERAWLERILHPLVSQRRSLEFAAAAPDARALVIDAPLLIEAGLDKDCDHLLFVDTPRPERLKRVERERGWNEEELTRRENAQDDLAGKRRSSDFVIDNGGDLDTLRERVAEFLKAIRT